MLLLNLETRAVECQFLDADLRAVVLAPFNAGSSERFSLTTLELTVLLIVEDGFVLRKQLMAVTWSFSSFDIDSRTFFRL